jgi:hypothetical protein
VSLGGIFLTLQMKMSPSSFTWRVLRHLKAEKLEEESDTFLGKVGTVSMTQLRIAYGLCS